MTGEELFLTDEDIAKYKDVDRKCKDIAIEIEVIRERVERYNTEIDVLTERSKKIFAEIDRLYAGRLTDEDTR